LKQHSKSPDVANQFFRATPTQQIVNTLNSKSALSNYPNTNNMIKHIQNRQITNKQIMSNSLKAQHQQQQHQ
jgi:hypothetical protein